MVSLKRWVLRTALVRKFSGALLRDFVDAENRIHFSTAPYRIDRQDRPIELTVCVTPGRHRTLLVRALTLLLDRLPDDAEILVADEGVARNVKRLFSDYPGVRYIDLSSRADARCSNGSVFDALVEQARGSNLLFIAADTLPCHGMVENALTVVREPRHCFDIFVGTVINPAGEVVEAGSRFDPRGLRRVSDSTGALPASIQSEHVHPATESARAAFLITRNLLEQVGTYPQRENHATFEEWCERVIRGGGRLGFDPRLAVIDMGEPASQPGDRASVDDTRSRTKAPSTPTSSIIGQVNSIAVTERSRAHPMASWRILFIEDRVPHPELGQGYPRSHLMLRTMDDAGHRVVLYPLQDPGESLPSIYRDIPRSMPVLQGLGSAGLLPFLAGYSGVFDLIIVARPHNMRLFRDAVDRLQPAIKKTLPPVVYDAEAIGALREIAKCELEGRPLPAPRAEALLRDEIELTRDCRLVVAVSELERSQFLARGVRNVRTLGHGISTALTTAAFEARSDFLFVGALVDLATPNSEGLRWFVDAVWPIVRLRLSQVNPRLLVAGKISDAMRHVIAGEDVEILGTVADLAPIYDRARVFVAPARYSAGIPLKILEAAAHGVPVVAGAAASSQLQWTNGVELLTADSAEAYAEQCVLLHESRTLWNGIRSSASDAVEATSSSSAYRRNVADLLRCAMEGSP